MRKSDASQKLWRQYNNGEIDLKTMNEEIRKLEDKQQSLFSMQKGKVKK